MKFKYFSQREYHGCAETHGNSILLNRLFPFSCHHWNASSETETKVVGMMSTYVVFSVGIGSVIRWTMKIPMWLNERNRQSWFIWIPNEITQKYIFVLCTASDFVYFAFIFVRKLDITKTGIGWNLYAHCCPIYFFSQCISVNIISRVFEHLLAN